MAASGSTPEPCPPRENPDWWATSSAFRTTEYPIPEDAPDWDADDTDAGSITFDIVVREELDSDIERGTELQAHPGG